MNTRNCKLYGVTRKRDIDYLLDNKDKNINIFKYNHYIKPYVELDKNGVPKRLIERIDKVPSQLNRVLYSHLKNIETPDWHFSKKGKSYIDNAIYHLENQYILALDLSKFFPNTSQSAVYHFFARHLNLQPDIASYLTNLCCVNLDLCTYESIEMRMEVERFLQLKKIRQRNHLISGASTSNLLSFLVHEEMFVEIHSLLKKHERMSVYVDDITISSNCPINKSLTSSISKLVYKYGHRLSERKTKFYSQNQYKKITGIMLSPDKEAIIPNAKRKEIVNTFGLYKESGYSDKTLQKKLRGLLTYARSIEKNAFPRIYEASR